MCCDVLQLEAPSPPSALCVVPSTSLECTYTRVFVCRSPTPRRSSLSPPKPLESLWSSLEKCYHFYFEWLRLFFFHSFRMNFHLDLLALSEWVWKAKQTKKSFLKTQEAFLEEFKWALNERKVSSIKSRLSLHILCAMRVLDFHQYNVLSSMW